MDKISAKKQLLKDVNALITHINDILESEEVGIDGSQADHIIDIAEDLKDYINTELLLSSADEEKRGATMVDVDAIRGGKKINQKDIDEWEKMFKDLYRKQKDQEASERAYGASCGSGRYTGSSCGSSSYSSGGSCGGGGGGGRGC